MARLQHPARLAWVLLGVTACGGGSSDVPLGGELRVGADFCAESRRSQREFQAQGFEVQVELEAQRFCAFAAADTEGRTRVRVATRRGWALAVDAPSSNHTRPRVGLWQLPVDFDHDGVEELFVTAEDPAADRTCAALIRVDEDGGADEVPVSVDLEGDACIVGIDAQALILQVRLARWSRGRVPRVYVSVSGPMWARARSMEDPNGPPNEEHSEYVRWSRGVESAARTHVDGGDVQAQMAAFDEVFGVAEGSWAEERESLVAWMDAGWRERDASESDTTSTRVPEDASEERNGE